MGTIQDQDIERQIAERLVDDALAAGYVVEVFDGEEFALKDGRDREAILAAMFSTDQDTLFFHRIADDGDARRIVSGFVLLIYGNGWDVISDYSGNAAIAVLVAGAEKLSDEFQELHDSAMHAGDAIAALANAGGA